MQWQIIIRKDSGLKVVEEFCIEYCTDPFPTPCDIGIYRQSYLIVCASSLPVISSSCMNNELLVVCGPGETVMICSEVGSISVYTYTYIRTYFCQW